MSSLCGQAKQTKEELLCVWGNSQTAAIEWTAAVYAVGPHNTPHLTQLLNGAEVKCLSTPPIKTILSEATKLQMLLFYLSDRQKVSQAKTQNWKGPLLFNRKGLSLNFEFH